MSEFDFVTEVWEKLPAETRLRIDKLATGESKSLADEIVFLLSEGVNTLTPIFLARGC